MSVRLIDNTWERIADGVVRMQLTAGDFLLDDDVELSLGSSADVQLVWSTGDASNHAFVVALGDDNQSLHVTDKGAIATDWNIAADTHPTVYIHSNTTPATDYLKLGAHDGTTAYIDNVGGTTIQFAIAGTNEVNLTASAFSPSTTDSNALGTTALMWSDLFLASGAVINFNNGGVTLTHDAVGDTLAIGSGTLIVPDGTAAAPGLRTTTDASGLFQPAAANVGMAGNGVELWRTSAGAFQFLKEVNATINVATSTTTNTAGATLTIASAAGVGSGAGGVLTINSGAGGATGNSGAITIQPGTVAAGAGGNINITGRAGVGSNNIGSTIAITAGASVGSGTGGAVTLTAGEGTGVDAANGIGGAITIRAGDSQGSNQNGGAVSITAGAAAAGGGTGVGGIVTITAGSGGGASGSGGTVSLIGGAATGTNRSGGGMIFRPGASNGSGATAVVAARDSVLFDERTETSITTDSDVVYTAAQVKSGVISRSGITANRNDSMPTAANLVAGIPGAEVGQSFFFALNNNDDASTLTMTTAATGITYDGNTAALAAGAARLYLVVLTNVTGASEAATVYGL